MFGEIHGRIIWQDNLVVGCSTVAMSVCRRLLSLVMNQVLLVAALSSCFGKQTTKFHVKCEASQDRV
jgi:hypothetical protein